LKGYEYERLQKHRWLYLRFQVESYFNRNTVSVDSKGVENCTYATGVVCARRRTIKKKICLTSLQTEGFVKNFETYIEYAKEELQRMQGSENAALSNLEEIRRFYKRSSVFFPCLKNANVDSLETSLIHEGISEQIKTNNPELNALQKRVYNNLSYYALIVSAGEIKKSTMIEALKR
jgi:hypothetical protein